MRTKEKTSVKKKASVGAVQKKPSKAALFKAYQDAGSNAARQKALNAIIGYVVQDPESAAAQVLERIARKGDQKCAKAIDPLVEIFWEGDFEWQEAVVELLGALAHLAPLDQRIQVAQFLGHVAVSNAFSPLGSTLDI